MSCCFPEADFEGRQDAVHLLRCPWQTGARIVKAAAYFCGDSVPGGLLANPTPSAGSTPTSSASVFACRYGPWRNGFRLLRGAAIDPLAAVAA